MAWLERRFASPAHCPTLRKMYSALPAPRRELQARGQEDDKSKAENQKKEAEEMKRYREGGDIIASNISEDFRRGLKDPEKYVLPPPSRMRELFGWVLRHASRI